MSQKIDAIFDGVSFHPSEPVAMAPNTAVTITVNKRPKKVSRKKKTKSWLEILRSAQLDGPPDWSSNLDEYLYRGKKLP